MRGLKRKLCMVGLSVFFVLGSFIGCGAEKKEESPKEVAKGYQWEATKDGKSIYLIGTMHPIDTGYNYFSDTVNEIVEKADVLSVEVNATEQDALLANAMLVKPAGETIEDDLNKEEIEKLKALCEDAGLDYEKMKVSSGLGINQNISAVVYDKANLSLATFDDMLIKKYEELGKEVTQVEDMKFQMELLKDIQGIDVLKESLKEYKKGEFEKLSKESVDYAKEIMEAYKNGDEAYMLEAIKMQKENPEVYDKLIKDRNAGMVEKIEGYMKEDKTYVVAVGALHFFGEDGIPAMLEDKGYTITKK